MKWIMIEILIGKRMIIIEVAYVTQIIIYTLKIKKGVMVCNHDTLRQNTYFINIISKS